MHHVLTPSNTLLILVILAVIIYFAHFLIVQPTMKDKAGNLLRIIYIYVQSYNRYKLMNFFFSENLFNIVLTITYKTFKFNILLFDNSIYTQEIPLQVYLVMFMLKKILLMENKIYIYYLQEKKIERKQGKRRKKDQNIHPHIV